MFPGFRLSLPPKRWFKDNYDSDFLEDRQLGLQAFLQNLIAHKDIANWYAVWLLIYPTCPNLAICGHPGVYNSLIYARTLMFSECPQQPGSERVPVSGRSTWPFW